MPFLKRIDTTRPFFIQKFEHTKLTKSFTIFG